MPDGPWPGTGAVLAAVETADRPHGRPGRRQARAGDVRDRAATASGPGACWRSATGSTSTSRARAAPAWTRRSCSPAARRAPTADAADPQPDARRRLARRARAAARRLASSGSHGPRRLPHRQPARRRRPRRRALPAVEAALRAHGLRFRVERTTSIEHARELARAAPRRRRDRGRDGRRRARRRGGRRAARHATACSRVLPGGRGNDFARKLGIGRRPGGGGRRARRRAGSGGSTSPRPAARVYLGILSAGFDSDVQVIANATRLPLGHARLPLRRAARAGDAGSRARWTVTDRRRAARASPATPSPSRTPACSAAGCGSCRTPSSTTGCSTSCSPATVPRRAYLRGLPQGVQGHARRRARRSTFLQRPRGHLRGRPAVHRVRRRRPDRRAARDRPRRSRARCGCSAP